MHIAALLFLLPRAALNTLWELFVGIIVVPTRYLLPGPRSQPPFPELPPIVLPPILLLDAAPYPSIAFTKRNATHTFPDGGEPAHTLLSAVQLEMSATLLLSLLAASVFVLITTLLWTYTVARADERRKTPPRLAQLYEELTGDAYDAPHWDRVGGDPRQYPRREPPPETWAGRIDSESLNAFAHGLAMLGYTEITSRQEHTTESLVPPEGMPPIDIVLFGFRAKSSRLTLLIFAMVVLVPKDSVAADARDEFYLWDLGDGRVRAFQFIGDCFMTQFRNDGDYPDDDDDDDEVMSDALIVHPAFGSRGVDMDALLEALSGLMGSPLGTPVAAWPDMDSFIPEMTLSNMDSGIGFDVDVQSPETPSVSLPSDLMESPLEQPVVTTEPSRELEILAVKQSLEPELIALEPEPEFVAEVVSIEQHTFIDTNTEELVIPEPESAVQPLLAEELIVTQHEPVVEFVLTVESVVAAPELTVDTARAVEPDFKATEQATPQADPAELGEIGDDLSASMLSNSTLEETLVESILVDSAVKTLTPEPSCVEGLGLNFGAATHPAENSPLPIHEDATPMDFPPPSDSMQPAEAVVGPSKPALVVETAAVDIGPPVVPQIVVRSPEDLVTLVYSPTETALATPEPTTSPVLLSEPIAQPVSEPTTHVEPHFEDSPMSTHSELSASDIELPTPMIPHELSEPLFASEELSDSIVLVNHEEPEPICIAPSCQAPTYNPGMLLSPISEVPEIITPVASEPPTSIASLVEAATQNGERMIYKAPQSFFRVYDDGKPLEGAPTKPFTRAGPHPPVGPATAHSTVS